MSLVEANECDQMHLIDDISNRNGSSSSAFSPPSFADSCGYVIINHV